MGRSLMATLEKVAQQAQGRQFQQTISSPRAMGGLQSSNVSYSQETGGKYDSLVKDLDSLISKGWKAVEQDMELTDKATELVANDMITQYNEKAIQISAMDVSTEEKKSRHLALNEEMNMVASKTIDMDNDRQRMIFDNSYTKKARISSAKYMATYDTEIAKQSAQQLLDHTEYEVKVNGTGPDGISYTDFMKSRESLRVKGYSTFEKDALAYINSVKEHSSRKALEDNNNFINNNKTFDDYLKNNVAGYESMDKDALGMLKEVYADAYKIGDAQRGVKTKEYTDNLTLGVLNGNMSISDGIADIKEKLKNQSGDYDDAYMKSALKELIVLSGKTESKSEAKSSINGMLKLLKVDGKDTNATVIKRANIFKSEKERQQAYEDTIANAKSAYTGAELANKLLEINSTFDKNKAMQENLVKISKGENIEGEIDDQSEIVVKQTLAQESQNLTAIDTSTEEGKQSLVNTVSRMLKLSYQTGVDVKSFKDIDNKMMSPSGNIKSVAEGQRMLEIGNILLEQDNKANYSALTNKELLSELNYILSRDVPDEQKIKQFNNIKYKYSSRVKNQNITDSKDIRQLTSDYNDRLFHFNSRTDIKGNAIAVENWRRVNGNKATMTQDDFNEALDSFYQTVDSSDYGIGEAAKATVAQLFTDEKYKNIKIPRQIGVKSGNIVKKAFLGVLEDNDTSLSEASVSIFTDDNGNPAMIIKNDRGLILDILEDSNINSYYRKYTGED
jgi:hypothetical protein